MYFQVTRFIMEAGVKLGMQSIPIATACTIYYKFFCKINLDAYDLYLVAMSSIYLACKVKEQQLCPRDIINVSLIRAVSCWSWIPASGSCETALYNVSFLCYEFCASKSLSSIHTSTCCTT